MFLPQILSETRKAIKELLDVSRHEKLIAMIVLSLLSAVMDVAGISLVVFLVQYVTRFGSSLTDFNLVTGALGLISFFVLKNVLNTFFNKFQAEFAFNEASLQSLKVLRNIYSQNELFFRDSETGALITDMMYVPSSFANGVILGYITLVTEFGVLILMVLFLILTSLTINFLLLVLLAPAAFFTYRAIKYRIESLGIYRNEQVKKAQDILIQTIHAHSDALLYNRTSYFENRFIAFQNEIAEADASVFTLNNVPSRLMELFAVVSFCGIYIFTSRFAGINAMPLNISLFIAAAFRLLPSINRTLSSMLRIKNHWFAVDALRKYHSSETNELPNRGALRFSEQIEFRNLEFYFGMHQVFRLQYFRLEKWKCIGIFGKTGEGKSIFLQVLCQLLPHSKGLIIIDDTELDEWSMVAYRQLFAYIPQDVFILNGSLEENISLSGEKDYDRIRVKAIINQLELHGIRHLFDNSENAGEAGNKLSGGQKKLMALARALYFDKPVLILDETFSSMDSETMKIAMDAVKQEKLKGKSIIIVSHQKEAFEACDLIYEFKNNTLIEIP